MSEAQNVKDYLELAVNTIDRIIDVFPPQQQQQIRVQLSQVLKTVISQQLMPAVDGGLVPAFEIMHLNNAVRTMVRDSRIHQIDQVIQTGAAEGMIGMDESILRLYQAGKVTGEVALRFAMAPEQLQKNWEDEEKRLYRFSFREDSMGRKNTRNTKARIVSAAWKLFYEQGYEDTTVEDIIFESETSKGSFYHYFDGKDALLSSLSVLFDERYAELMEQPDLPENSLDLLQYLNRSLFETIENTVAIDLLSRLFSSQLVTHGEKHLLDRNRTYYKLLRRIISEGQEKGEIRTDFTVGEISKAYAMFERGLMYDWCLSGGEYSLPNYAERMMPIFLNGFRTNEKSSG